MIVRFAPSPTGLLHVGNARTALINALFARNQGAKFLLRIDDTDQERSQDHFEQAIKQDLQWLGIEWSKEVRQSDRYDLYNQAMKKLKASGRLYPCYETPEELSLKRKSLLARGLPPVYDRAALQETDEDRARYESEGRTPHWRFLLEDTTVAWSDLVRGEIKFEGCHTSDPVLVRADGVPIYTLASVVDDGDLSITHVVRGEDHVANTAVQIQLFEALGYAPPIFAHMSLISDKDGGGLSKRLGSLSLTELRESGIDALPLASYLAKIGTSDSVRLGTSFQELIDDFDFGKFGRASPKFDPDELKALQTKYLHNLSWTDVAPWLQNKGIDDPDFWLGVRGNIETLSDVMDWWRICRCPVEPTIDPENADYVAQAATLLPPLPWDESTWSNWTNTLKQETGRKGKSLFMPLRLALTAQTHGPELKNLLPLLGPDRVKQRLQNKTESA
jgi:glutamyl-tRNA synthetase